jgi:hypothetical protein
LLLIDDAKRGLADIVAGSTFEANGAIDKVQQRRNGVRQTSKVTLQYGCQLAGIERWFVRAGKAVFQEPPKLTGDLGQLSP